MAGVLFSVVVVVVVVGHRSFCHFTAVRIVLARVEFPVHSIAWRSCRCRCCRRRCPYVCLYVTVVPYLGRSVGGSPWSPRPPPGTRGRRWPALGGYSSWFGAASPPHTSCCTRSSPTKGWTPRPLKTASQQTIRPHLRCLRRLGNIDWIDWSAFCYFSCVRLGQTWRKLLPRLRKITELTHQLRPREPRVSLSSHHLWL